VALKERIKKKNEHRGNRGGRTAGKNHKVKREKNVPSTAVARGWGGGGLRGRRKAVGILNDCPMENRGEIQQTG